MHANAIQHRMADTIEMQFFLEGGRLLWAQGNAVGYVVNHTWVYPYLYSQPYSLRGSRDATFGYQYCSNLLLY